MLLTMTDVPLTQVSETPKEMLSVLTLPDGRTKVRINFSSLSIMQECWRKTEYSLLRNLRSNLESPATIFGSAIHKALEVYYSAPRTERGIPKQFRDVMDSIACGQWQPEWEEHAVFRGARGFVSKAALLKVLPPENKRSINAGIWILRHYFESYVTDPFIVMFDANGPIVERKFTMPIYEDEKLVIEGFGQIDVVLKNEQSGVILPTDHKTTSQLGPQFYQRLHPNFQYSFYTWAARDVLGLQTESFLVNALQVKELPKTSRGSGPQFARQVTTRRQEDFDELKMAILNSVNNFLELRAHGIFPQSTPGPCANYNGCQYLDICSAPAQLRESVIRAKYQDKGAQL